MDKYNQLFTEIFNQPLAHEANVAMLEKTVQEYPFFTPAHFFLLHLTDKSSAAFAEHARKTIPLFNNNYWLNFQLLELNQKSQEKESLSDLPSTGEDGYEPVIEKPITAADLQPGFVNDENNAPDQNTGYADEAVEPVAENSFKSTIENELPSEAIIEDVHEPSDHESGVVIESNVAAEENVAAEAANEFVPEEIPLVAVVETMLTTEAIQVPLNEPAGAALFHQQVIGDDAGEKEIEAVDNSVAAHQFDTFGQEESADFTEEEFQRNEDLQNDTDFIAAETPADAEMEKVSARMAETLSGITLERESVEETVAFEPLHASDYFASVGIKLSEEVKPADKLGHQLKSFTEWLKTMKKVHAEQLVDTSTSSEVAHDKTDKKIQELAEASNKENEVLTEAMADVFQQQGKTGKAIEVFEKLSLLNPSKMTYFAAKIKQLKD